MSKDTNSRQLRRHFVVPKSQRQHSIRPQPSDLTELVRGLGAFRIAKTERCQSGSPRLANGDRKTTADQRHPRAAPAKTSLVKWASTTVLCKQDKVAPTKNSQRPRGYKIDRPTAKAAAVAQCADGKL